MKTTSVEISEAETNRAAEAADNFIMCCRAVIETAPPLSGKPHRLESLGFALGSVLVQAAILAHVRTGTCTEQDPRGDTRRDAWIPPEDFVALLMGMAHAVGHGCGSSLLSEDRRGSMWQCEAAMKQGFVDAGERLRR